MKPIPLLFLILSISHTLYAQEFDLNSYKFRYQKYRGLTFTLNLNNTGIQSFYSFKDTMNKIDFFDNNMSLFTNLSINPQYFEFQNSERIQLTRSIGISDQFGHTAEIQDDIQAAKQKANGWSNDLTIRYNQTGRYYNNLNFLYLSFGGTSNYDIGKQNSEQPLTIDLTAESKALGINAYAQFGIGTGRLEFVSDAVLAMFISKDMANKLGSSTSNEQIEGIAKGITFTKNQRYLDFRFGLIDQLTMMDSVLKTNGLEGDNIIYFTCLNDNWLYANNLSRFTGSRWTYYLDLRGISTRTLNDLVVDYINRKQYQTSIQSQQEYDAGITIDYSSSIQRSLYVQRAYGLSLHSSLQFYTDGYYTYTAIDIPPGKEKNQNYISTDIWYSSFLFYWQYLYQPNTRNYLISTITPGLNFYNHLYNIRNKDIDDISQNELSPYLNYNLEYYHWISPQFNFNIGFDLRLMNTNGHIIISDSKRTLTDNVVYHALQAGFRYQFF